MQVVQADEAVANAAAQEAQAIKVRLSLLPYNDFALISIRGRNSISGETSCTRTHEPIDFLKILSN